MTRIGFDLAKEAILLAAKSDKKAAYFVADLAAIPLADGCCDVVLVFSRRRIMRSSGAS